MADPVTQALLLIPLALVHSGASGQSRYQAPAPMDHLAPPAKDFVVPRDSVDPFYQWDGNNGYCGEVSIMQAAMNHGMWMSQYNARLICGTGLSQSGPDGFCAAHGGSANYNAQVLLENLNPGDQVFASAGMCLRNARLRFREYDYSKQPPGMAGFEDFMSWVKAEVIKGHLVTVGVLNRGGTDPQYDHEVTVSKIGTNHSPDDPTYYDDDVLYFDDHSNSSESFVEGYTFQSLAKSRDDANKSDQRFSILIPGAFPILSQAGGDGIANNAHPITAANYAFSVVGPEDTDRVTLPVKLTIVGSSVGGVASTPSSFYGYDFEKPEIGDCTNAAPASWISLSIEVKVSGLVPGVGYNLYNYDFGGVSGTGEQAALAIPDSDFNERADQASAVTHFVADAAEYTEIVETTSDRIVIFRAVPDFSP